MEIDLSRPSIADSSITTAAQKNEPGLIAQEARQPSFVLDSTEPLTSPAESLPSTEIDPRVFRAQIQAAVRELNSQLESLQRDLRFHYDERINREIVTVKKTSTGEVVRQVPPEVVVRLAHRIEDLKGVLFDESF